MRNLDFLIWIGAALTMIGLAGIIWCIIAARNAKRDHLEDAALRARMQRIVSVNMGALGSSLIGLMLVVLGVILGR